MPNLLRVRTVFAYGAGSPGLMTQYLGNEAAEYVPADAQVAVDRVRDAMLSKPNLWPTSFVWTVSGDVDELQDTDGEVIRQFAATPRTGAGIATQALGPLPVGCLLKARTDTFVDGRRLVGRTFFVPLQEAVVSAPTVSAGLQGDFLAIGTAMLNAGLTNIFPYVWSRPRPATEVGPGRPAGPARSARVGSSAPVVSYSCSSKYVVLTSRRD